MNDFSALPADSLKQFVLDKTRVGSRLTVDSYVLQSSKFRVEEGLNLFADELVVGLEAFVLQDKLPPKTVEKDYVCTTPPVPTTWWDHFKHTYRDRTWLKHLIVHLKPPMYTAETKNVTLRVDLERWISYPEAQNIPETFGRQYRGYNVKSSLWDS
jgi:hypothetical protein